LQQQQQQSQQSTGYVNEGESRPVVYTANTCH
jgi:hypothetical protein